ncbi:MAG: hypothetical protein ACRD0P_01340, partial [Stackebrandtia sp.]
MAIGSGDLLHVAERLQMAAAAAKLMEMTGGQPQLGATHFGEHMAQYAWVVDWIPEFGSPASTEFNSLSQSFGQMVTVDFKVPAIGPNGVPAGVISDRFAEIDHLSTIIDESDGHSYLSFRDNVLLKLDTMWTNQAAIAHTLGVTAQIEARIYDSGREDVVALANRAIQRCDMVCARERGEDPVIEGQATKLSVASLAIGLAGLVAWPTVMTLGSALLGAASLASEDDPVEVPDPKVQGSGGVVYDISG